MLPTKDKKIHQTRANRVSIRKASFSLLTYNNDSTKHHSSLKINHRHQIVLGIKTLTKCSSKERGKKEARKKPSKILRDKTQLRNTANNSFDDQQIPSDNSFQRLAKFLLNFLPASYLLQLCRCYVPTEKADIKQCKLEEFIVDETVEFSFQPCMKSTSRNSSRRKCEVKVFEKLVPRTRFNFMTLCITSTFSLVHSCSTIYG